MADDQIAVELVAKVAQLNSGCDQARDALGRFVKGASEDLHSLAETSKESEGALESILSIEKWRIFAEAAKIALEVVKEGFEATIGKAEEFGLSNAKFAAMMGTAESEAAGLSAALRGVGSSAENYEGMALRLEMRLRTMEPAMQQLGIATRDHSGALLSGKELMDSAIATMQTYKDGTDQNSFALDVFGRKAKDIYQIMRVGDEQVAHQTAIYAAFGVQLDGNGEQSVKLEEAMNDLHTEIEAIGIVIGQKVMPIVVEFLKWLGEVGAKDVGLLVQSFKDTAIAAGQVSMVMLEVLSGDWGKAADDGKKAWDAVGGAIKTDTDLAHEFGRSIDDLVGRMGKLSGQQQIDERSAIEGGETNPFKPKSGGTRHFVAPDTKKPKKEKEDKAPDDAIKDAERLALAKLAIEESTDQHIFAMGQENADALEAQQLTLENEKYAIKQAALNQELALAGRTKTEHQKTLDELALLEVTHQGEITKIQQEGDSKRATLAKEDLSNAIRADEERLKEGMAAIAQEVESGAVAKDKKATLEMQLTTEVRQEQLKRLDDALATLTPETKAYDDVVKQKLALEKKFTADLKSENAERRKDMAAEVTQYVTPLVGGFKSAINEMVFQGKSFQQSMDDMFKSIAQGFVSMLEQMAEKWLVTQIANALIGKTTAVSEISANAGVAASGAAASQAGVPFIGPALAAAAAAETAAMVLGYESLASAAGGMTLDRDQLVFAHKQEMVLPAHISQGLQAMIAGGGGGGGGDTNLHYSPTINAPQSATLEQMLREQSGAMMSFLAQKQRDGAFRSR
jgi:hypothetical protein